MNTCSNCRHWRPHAGSPTNMVCGLIRSTNTQQSHPRVILDLVHQKPADYPMVLATPASFGCRLYEDQQPRTEHAGA